MEREKLYPGKRTMPKRRPMRRIFRIVCLLTLLVSLIALLSDSMQSSRNKAAFVALSAQHEAARADDPAPETAMPARTVAVRIAAQATPTVEPQPFFQTIGLARPSFKPILAQNSEAVGWISIPDVVDLPIVYRNNTYYLTHDFYGKKNVCGALFLDEKHPIRANAQNLLVYGHNMRDQSMFGRLSKFVATAFLRTHLQVRLETRFEVFTYLIFAVDIVSTDPHAPNFLDFWRHPKFAGAASFIDYIDRAYKRSMYARYLDVRASDTLLTLSTCMGEDRLVLLARRMRAGETERDIQRYLLKVY